jgi:hypothetical protein
MAKKANRDTTTTWIRYSQAKALAGEYLGDPEFVEREFRKGLKTRDIPWQCERFETPEGYSGPGRGDPDFWREPDNLITSERGLLIAQLDWLTIEGDSARRINGAAAYGIDLDRSALVRLRLLPSSDVTDDRSSAQEKRKKPQVDRIMRALEDPELFPGGVPSDMKTNVALPIVVEYLKPETKRLRLLDPEWDSVDRALKLYRAKHSSAQSA